MDNIIPIDIVVVACAIVGQVTHIVKKKTEKSGGEVAAFKKWIIGKPFNTLAAVAASITAAYALQVDGMTVVQAAGVAFSAGFAANSAINRG